MINGAQNTVLWFEETNLSYWAIYKKGETEKGIWVCKSSEADEVSAGAARDELKRKIAILDRGTYTITATDKPKGQPRGFFKTDFELDTRSSSAAPIVQTTTGISQQDVEVQIKKALDDYKRDQEYQSLKRELEESKKENRELKKKIDDPWNKVIGAISPYSDKIISGMFNQPAQVAGLNPAKDLDNNNTSQGLEITDEQEATIKGFLQTLIASDADWENTLKKLDNKIKANPGVISMVKNFL